MKDYLHRSGRTARAGAEGNVIALVTPDKRERAIRCNGAYAGRNMTSDRCRPTMPPAPQLPKAELRSYRRALFAGPSTGELAGAGPVGKEDGNLAGALRVPGHEGRRDTRVRKGH